MGLFDSLKKGTGKGRLDNLVRDLTSLEINTIVTSGITARPMKNPRHALFDIGRAFQNELDEIIARHRDVPALGRDGVPAADLEKESRREPDGPPSQTAGYGHLREQLARFEGLRSWRKRGSLLAFDITNKLADELLHDGSLREAFTPAERSMLTRIKMLSAELEEILWRAGPDGDRNELLREEINRASRSADAATDLELDVEDMVTLRKIWEVGADTIAMQTVITLSGDVATRLVEEHNQAGHAALHRFHQDGVRTALSAWHSLVSTVAEFVGSAVKGLKG